MCLQMIMSYGSWHVPVGSVCRLRSIQFPVNSRFDVDSQALVISIEASGGSNTHIQSSRWRTNVHIHSSRSIVRTMLSKAVNNDDRVLIRHDAHHRGLPMHWAARSSGTGKCDHVGDGYRQPSYAAIESDREM